MTSYEIEIGSDGCPNDCRYCKDMNYPCVYDNEECFDMYYVCCMCGKKNIYFNGI